MASPDVQPAMTDTSTAAPGGRRPLLIAAAAAAVALLVGGIALVATGGDDDPPRLDLSASAPSGGAGGERLAESDTATDGMAGMSMMAWVTYLAGDELPDLGGSAPVYRLVADDDDLRALAGHFGIEGDVTEPDGTRMITDGTASVSRHDASWWYTSGRPYPGFEDMAPDTGVSCDAEGVCEDSPRPMPEPERPADLPNQAEAEGIVRAVAEAAGLDLSDARITSYDNITTWSVNIELALDGTPVPGWSVYGTVMEGGEVLDAGGALGSLERVGDYPLDTTRVAIDRLNDPSSGPGTAEPAVEPGQIEPDQIEPGQIEPDVVTGPASPDDPAAGGGTTGSGETDAAPPSDEMTILPVDEGDGEPITVTLRSARQSYTVVGNADGTETYLVPVYLLDGEDDRGEAWTEVFAIAVRAEFLGA